MDATSPLRVALVHDWLTGMRGGEKCLEVLCRHWPDADLYTLLHAPGKTSDLIERRPIRTSFLQRLPGVARYYRHLLPLMPAAIRSFRLTNYDLVVSFSHCVAKSIRPPVGVPHVCYCFTPMRYIWHMRDAYLARAKPLTRLALASLLGILQTWDRQTARDVTHFIAISKTVQDRIRECYGRDSVVIYPPVDTDFYAPARVRRDEYYLIVSAFAPYKRLDLAIEACNRLRRHLLIIGSGQEETVLRKLAGPTVRFAGWQSDEVIRDHLHRCRALLFPGEEDFGIVPLEAHACGTPVICHGRGGATETVIPLNSSAEPTGVWFEEQSADALVEAMQKFEAQEGAISPLVCRRQALRFNRQRFEQELLDYLMLALGRGRTVVRQAA